MIYSHHWYQGQRFHTYFLFWASKMGQWLETLPAKLEIYLEVCIVCSKISEAHLEFAAICNPSVKELKLPDCTTILTIEFLYVYIYREMYMYICIHLSVYVYVNLCLDLYRMLQMKPSTFFSHARKIYKSI